MLDQFFRGMKRRDLLLRRYWRREDDGAYGNVDFRGLESVNDTFPMN